MKPNKLDEALSQMRNVAPSPEQMKQASTRVLHNLGTEFNKVVAHPAVEGGSVARIESCEDFRALIPAYLASNLAGSRRLLLEDHLLECVHCRRATGAPRGVSHPGKSQIGKPLRWNRRLVLGAGLTAAAMLVGVALETNFVRDILWPIDVHATAQIVDGGLYLVWGQEARPIAAGQRIERNQALRTGANSGAVLELADGSRIEMSARSELWLDRARDGVQVKLQRGNVIVTAAKQGEGHLYVETSDCVVSVVGTVFAVNAGAKGSRVSVIEGQVNVVQGNAIQALTPGQQIATNPAMGGVAVQDEIAWSRNVSAHLALLKEFASFSKDLARRIESAEMRFTSSLVPLVPESTLLVASLPNVSQSFAESYSLLRKRIDEHPELKDWWLNNSRASGVGVDDMVSRLTRVGAYLGPEVIIALPKDLASEGPVVLANVTSAAGLTSALEGLDTSKLVISVDQGLLVVSPDATQVQRTLAFRQQPASNRFAGTALYRRLAQAYTEGVGWLFAADLQRLVNVADTQTRQMGLAEVEQLVIEQKTGPNGANYRASLGFSQTRRGMAAWLSEPAPMGALEFISPNASGVAAVITKDPTLIFDDVFALIQNEPKALEDFEEFQRQNRLNLREDLAASLGNEFLVGLDGPLLPTPSWRVVIEVNDAARLQNAIEWSVTNLNREAAIRQEPPMVVTSETVGGRTFYLMSGSARFPTGIHYTYWMGYIILAPSRALLMESIQNRDTGNTLARSAAFRSQLPADGRDYASGFVYQNILNIVSNLPTGLAGAEIDALKASVVDSLPTLISLYGEPTRIVMSSKGVLGMNIASIGGLNGIINAAGIGPNGWRHPDSVR